MKRLDELQLLERGNVFKHGLLILAGLVLLNTFLENSNIFVLNDKWSAPLFVLITVAACGIEMSCHDIYPITGKRQKYLMFFIGLFGIASIAVSIFEMLNKRIAFIDNRDTFWLYISFYNNSLYY